MIKSKKKCNNLASVSVPILFITDAIVITDNLTMTAVLVFILER